MKSTFKSFFDSLLVPVIFYVIAVLMWQKSHAIFYLLNFGYIGTAILVGELLHKILPRKKKPIGRKVTLLLIGLYMLVFLGFLGFENMQLEGFFVYLLAGFFAGATLHYIIAKIFGPLIFGRAWCSWACWTAMILDFLPYKKSPGRIDRKWEWLPYVHFVLSLGIVLILWFGFHHRPTGGVTELSWLMVGNLLYFGSAIPMAILLQDNRAFCKYLCPIIVLLKIGTRFSMLRIKGQPEKCNECGACAHNCPMDIDIPAYILNGQRVLSTECIFCQTCIHSCATQALSTSFRFDVGGKEIIQTKSAKNRAAEEKKNMGEDGRLAAFR